MKKSLLVLLVISFSLFLFSCATGGERPRAEIGGEITLVGTTPGVEVEINIPLEVKTEEEKEETEESSPIKEETTNTESEMEVTPISPIEETPIEKEETPTPVASETIEEEEAMEEVSPVEEEVIVEFAPVDSSSLFSLFNYAYGLKTLDDIKAENISLNAKYFARGVLDATIGAVPVLVDSTEIQSTIDQYVLEYYYEGKTFTPGERPLSITELKNLDKPSNLEEAFSYAYTFSIMRELIDGEVDIIADPFILGGLDSLLNTERLLDDKGVEKAINDYISYLNEEYLKEIETKGETNSERAKAFMEKNGKNDGVVTLDNGIQLFILDEDDILGEHPTQYDTVLVDYNMYVLDYDTEDLEIIDADYYAELRLMEIDSALQSSIVALKVGQAGRTWIPPEMLYGERNIEGIEPNSIIVYDIALHDIL